jgi:hypothetical protein
MKIKNWQEYNLMLEALGVSEESIIFKDFISNYIWNEYLEFFEKDDNNKSSEIKLPWILLKPHINKDNREIWKRFPVKEFNLTFKFGKNIEKEFGDGRNFATGGGMHHLSARYNSKWYSYVIPETNLSEKALSLRMYIEIFTRDEFDFESESKKLYTDLKSTVSHELNHGYEYFKRMGFERNFKKTIDSYLGTSFFSDKFKNPNSRIISHELWEEWNGFCWLLYYSEPHEVNAMTQETWEFIQDADLDLSTTEEFEDYIKQAPTWEHAENLVNFNDDEFYKGLLELSNNNLEAIQLLKNELMKHWLKAMDRDKVTDKVYYPMDFLRKTDTYGFIKYFAKRFDEQGNRLKRNLLRLNTLYQKSKEL